MTMPMHSHPAALGRWLVTCVLFLGALLIASQGFSTGNQVVLLSLVYVPLLVLLISRISWWFIIVLAAFHSWLYVPGLPTSLGVFHLAAMGIVPVLLAGRLLRSPEHAQNRVLSLLAVAFVLSTAITVCVRGFGIRALGGETWGGAGYIHIAIAAMFYLTAQSIVLSERQWRIALLLFFISGLLPPLAEGVFLLSGGEATALYRFIAPDPTSALPNAKAMARGLPSVRFQLSQYGSYLLPLAFALFPLRGRGRLAIAAAGAVAAVLAVISGHRIAVLQLIIMVPLFLFFWQGKAPLKLVCVMAVCLLLTGVALHYHGREVPYGMQRAFSWVPGADISAEARDSAMDTTTWRLQLWRDALAQVPRYWLVGRGFAFNMTEYHSLMYTHAVSTRIAFLTHAYHNGPLSLLVDLGAMGLFFGVAIMVCGVLQHQRLRRMPWRSESLSRCHAAVLTFFATEVILFFGVHGHAPISFPSFFVTLTMLDSIRVADAAQAQAPAQAPAAAPPTRRPARPAVSPVPGTPRARRLPAVPW